MQDSGHQKEELATLFFFFFFVQLTCSHVSQLILQVVLLPVTF